MAKIQPLEPDTKNMLQSTTVLGSSLVLIVALGKMYGYDLSPLSEVQTELLVVAGAVLAIIGRFRASKRIKFW